MPPRQHKAKTRVPSTTSTSSRRNVWIALGVAIVATAAVIAVAQTVGGGSTRATPRPVVDLGGIPQSGTALGSPTAKVRLIEYADVQCPGCRFYTENVFPVVVREYVRPGKVQTEFRGFPFIGEDSLKGERFLLAAAEQGRLFQLMETFYRHQGRENSGWLTDDLIREVASEIPGLDVDRLFERAESEELTRAAAQSATAAQQAGITGTPTLLLQVGKAKPYEVQIASVDDMRAALDDALGG